MGLRYTPELRVNLMHSSGRSRTRYSVKGRLLGVEWGELYERHVASADVVSTANDDTATPATALSLTTTTDAPAEDVVVVGTAKVHTGFHNSLDSTSKRPSWIRPARGEAVAEHILRGGVESSQGEQILSGKGHVRRLSRRLQGASW